MHVERFSYEREAVDRKRCTEYRRPYRTELLHRFFKQTPTDTAVLTLVCGKCRFNDLTLTLVMS